MKLYFIRPVAVFVMVAVTWVAAVPRVDALLIPANLVETGQTATRAADQKTIETTLESKVLRARLHALGLSDAEIQSRLSRLSDTQRHQLASQIRAVNPAGDGGGFIIGVLLIAVLVLLIIYLAKRV